MKAEKNRSDIESKLKSEDPTEVGDDMIFSEEEESWEVVVTFAERRDPAAVSAGGEQDAERRGDVPVPRKRAARTGGEADTVTTPFGAVAGLVPTCRGRGQPSQAVRGAGLYRHVARASANA